MLTRRTRREVIKTYYQRRYNKTDTRKNASTCPRNLTQPSFVKKSYLYRGIAPRITIRKSRQRQIFTEITVVKEEKKIYKLVPIKGVQRFKKSHSSI